MNPALIAIVIERVTRIRWYNHRMIAQFAMESRAG